MVDGRGDQLAVAALEFRCRHLSDSLRESLGIDGASGLFARGIAECEKQHPALTGMRGPDEREIQLQGVSEAVDRHGLHAVQAAVEALHMSLAGILGRLIGEDMAMQLMHLERPQSEDSGQRS